MNEYESRYFWNQYTLNPNFPNQAEVRQELSDGYQIYILAPLINSQENG